MAHEMARETRMLKGSGPYLAIISGIR
ncbi:hypothetical protein E2C01_021834 [Portunus trituberculatus]|uniref:Uncharacterized protein n=1 Tax=Portunus trituberculatus TaxID=210409 RepID=A0A5B7E5Z6_PORTR|nr:hypothetical protein [Portunus trituberculatus]